MDLDVKEFDIIIPYGEMDLHPLNMIYRRNLWRPAVEKDVYQKTAEHRYAAAAADVYHFILDKMVDTRPGSEWFWQTDKYGTPAHKPIVEPWKVIAEPAGFLIAPRGWERVSDVSNVVFTNGAIADDDGKVYIYYAASDTRLHVASTTIGQLLDFAFKKLADPWSASARRLRPGARKAVVPAQSVMRKNYAST